MFVRLCVSPGVWSSNLALGRGKAHPVLEFILEVTPSNVKGHPEVNLPYKLPMPTK